MIAPGYLDTVEILESRLPESALDEIEEASGSRAAVGIAQGTILLNGHLLRRQK